MAQNQGKIVNNHKETIYQIYYSYLKNRYNIIMPPNSRKEFVFEDISLNACDKTLVYNPRIRTPNIHWGQLKLFTTTSAFLIYSIGNKPGTIIYPGAGSGEMSINNELIGELFPDHDFHMYDPAGFGFKESHNIHLYEDYFTDDEAEKWSKHKNIYLISDIRSENIHGFGPEWEKKRMDDMNMQMKWHNMTGSKRSMLKFVFPFDDTGEDLLVDYLDGTIIKQPFSGPQSTESRLIVEKDSPIVQWNAKTYEQQMFYHNVMIRPRRFGTAFMEPYLTNDYDSQYFVYVMRDYLRKFKSVEPSVRFLREFLMEILTRLSKSRGKTIIDIRKTSNKRFLHSIKQ